MPRPSRWLIKTALGYLALALGLGLVRALQGAGLISGDPAALWLPQLHVLTVGWITQLIFGVAYWLFPRSREGDWGAVLVWVAYGTLNAGLALRVVCEPGFVSARARAWGLVVSAALQWLGSLLLAVHFWGRVRTK